MGVARVGGINGYVVRIILQHSGRVLTFMVSQYCQLHAYSFSSLCTTGDALGVKGIKLLQQCDGY